MLTLKLTSQFIKSASIKRCLLKLASTSVQPVPEPRQEEYEKDLKTFEKIKSITRKIRTKKPQREPFVKNLLLGDFDTEILTYPQLEKEDVESIQRDVSNVEKLMKQPHMVKARSLSEKKFRQNLSDYRAIGLQASQILDGREAGTMESTRILEALSGHELRDSLIHNEQLSVQTLIKFANEALKKKYLHPLILGEKLAAFCMTEHNLADATSMQTTATLSEDEKTYILNGTKCWVINGLSADYYIVIAVTNTIQRDIEKEVKLTAFLVEKDFPGVSCEKLEPSSSEIANVSFNNTPVPIENIIGEVDKGELLLKSIITDFRLSSGSLYIPLMKDMLYNLRKHVIEQITDAYKLDETDAIRSRIGEMCVNLYAMESVTYLTAGLQDWYENQDVFVESLIVKAFSSQIAFDSSTQCLDLIGHPAAQKDHWSRRLHEECVDYFTLHEPIDSQKIIISLMCLQHAGSHLAEKVRMMRNPLFYAAFVWKRALSGSRNEQDNPKLDLNLGDYLHPSLLPSAKLLEYCVKRLQYATEVLLSRHGLDVVNKHIELRRLAECIIDIYVATACLGRASRSYCIGLQNGDLEMLMATTFCLEAKDRVKYRVKRMYEGMVMSTDVAQVKIGKRFFENRGYFAKHPLSRNF